MCPRAVLGVVSQNSLQANTTRTQHSLPNAFDVRRSFNDPESVHIQSRVFSGAFAFGFVGTRRVGTETDAVPYGRSSNGKDECMGFPNTVGGQEPPTATH